MPFLKSSNSGWVTAYENLNRLSGEQIRNILLSDFDEIGHLVQRRKGHASWRISFNSEPIFLKQYFPRSFWNRLTYVFRINRAKKEFETHCRLDDMGFPVAELYAFSEQTAFKLWKQSCLVFRYYADYINLNSVVAGDDDMSLSRDLAKLIAKLHDRGVHYGDLHGGNILVLKTTEKWGFLLVDMDKVSFHQTVSDSDYVDDLARLNAFIEASTQQRLRFLFEYAKLRNLTNTSELFLKVNLQTEQIWRERLVKHGKEERKYPSVIG